VKAFSISISSDFMELAVTWQQFDHYRIYYCCYY